jgi:hypothetical protein
VIERCIPTKKDARDLKIVAVSASGLESKPLNIRIVHE